MKRILIFGDSILKGVYYSDEEGRHRLYRERTVELTRAGFEVKNCSVMGATVKTGEELLRRKLADALPAGKDRSDTAVILEYGGNDCDYRWQEISEDPEGDFLPNTPEDAFVDRYRACIDYVRSSGAKAYLCNLVPLDPDRYMEWISRDRSRENILRWLGDVGRLYRWQAFYSSIAERIASLTDTPLIPVREAFMAADRYQDLISPDGIHPTVEGHRVIDQVLLRTIPAV